MDRQTLPTALNDFIRSGELRAAALSGSWGVGKTYLWHRFAESLAVPDGYNGVSYASLFGASSIEELRAKVTEGLALTKDRKAIIARYKDASSKSLIPRELPAKTLTWIQSYLRHGMSNLFAEAAYWFVRDCLVCLDDIERCGKNLDAKSLMGFVDELRNRGCKVVLILNRNEIPSEDQAIETYWEKVIDIDLELSPSVDQNVEIIFGTDFEPQTYVEFVRSVFALVGCNNIRIHKRVAWLIRRITPSISGLRQSLQKEVVEHATLLAWALLDPNVDVSPDTIGSARYGSLWVAVVSQGNARDQLTDEEEKWAKIVERTGYSPAAFDKYLGSLIKSGWCDEAELVATLEATNEEEASELARQRLYDVFDVYRSSFTTTQDSYIALLRGVLKEELANLSVFDFDSGISSLDGIGDDTIDLTAEYIALRAEHLQAVAEARHRDHSPDNPVLMTEIERREAAFRNNRFTIDTVAHHIATSDSYGEDQIEFLASRTPAEYEYWAMSGPDDLHDKIKAILRFRGNDQGRYVNAVANLEAALLSIAAQDDFNADRIWRAYGVVADPDNPQ